MALDATSDVLPWRPMSRSFLRRALAAILVWSYASVPLVPALAQFAHELDHGLAGEHSGHVHSHPHSHAGSHRRPHARPLAESPSPLAIPRADTREAAEHAHAQFVEFLLAMQESETASEDARDEAPCVEGPKLPAHLAVSPGEFGAPAPIAERRDASLAPRFPDHAFAPPVPPPESARAALIRHSQLVAA